MRWYFIPGQLFIEEIILYNSIYLSVEKEYVSLLLDLNISKFL